MTANPPPPPAEPRWTDLMADDADYAVTTAKGGTESNPITWIWLRCQLCVSPSGDPDGKGILAATSHDLHGLVWKAQEHYEKHHARGAADGDARA